MCACEYETGECQAPMGCKVVTQALIWRAALEKIVAIEDQMWGPDWEEIEQARGIAIEALRRTNELEEDGSQDRDEDREVPCLCPEAREQER